MVTSPDKRGKKRSREWRDDTITCENAVTSILVRPSSAVSALEAKRPKWVPGTPKGVQTPIFLILDMCLKKTPRIRAPLIPLGSLAGVTTSHPAETQDY